MGSHGSTTSGKQSILGEAEIDEDASALMEIGGTGNLGWVSTYNMEPSVCLSVCLSLCLGFSQAGRPFPSDTVVLCQGFFDQHF